MTKPAGKGAQAGGFILAAAILAGVAGGIYAGQPSLGFLTGTGIGIAAALAVWLINRRQ